MFTSHPLTHPIFNDRRSCQQDAKPSPGSPVQSSPWTYVDLASEPATLSLSKVVSPTEYRIVIFARACVLCVSVCVSTLDPDKNPIPPKSVLPQSACVLRLVPVPK
jgi:hypothetical protein